jgi:hypothetical protein
MSRENVELVRRLYAQEGPFALPLSPEEEGTLLDRLFEVFYDEQVEVRMPADYPEGEQVHVGRRGMAELIAMLRDSWTERETAHVWAVRGGRLPSIQIYRDRAQALEAVGLSERSPEAGDI